MILCFCKIRKINFIFLLSRRLIRFSHILKGLISYLLKRRLQILIAKLSELEIGHGLGVGRNVCNFPFTVTKHTSITYFPNILDQNISSLPSFDPFIRNVYYYKDTIKLQGLF